MTLTFDWLWVSAKSLSFLFDFRLTSLSRLAFSSPHAPFYSLSKSKKFSAIGLVFY